MMNYGRSIIGGLFVMGFFAGTAFSENAVVDYPKDYRQWIHVKSMVIQKGHPLFDAFGGIHHIYANEKAREGYRSHAFQDGSVIVFDLLSADMADGALVEGKRKVTAVMQKDMKQFKDTGGWGFEGFAEGKPAERVVKDPVKQCFECHTSQKDKDYVFSAWRE